MKFYVGNKIFIEDPNQDAIKWCEENLVIDNPEFIKKERLGLWTGGTVRKINLYEKNGNTLITPFGCVARLRKQFSGFPFYSRISPQKGFKYRSGISPYDYQEKAIQEALRAKNGIIVAPCGSGKTQIGLEIIARLGAKTLWLTHTQDLLNQSMSRAKSVFESWGYGTITGGKVDIGESITFATVQTMSKLDLTQYRDTWDCVIVDECHRCIGSPTRVMQFYKVLSHIACRYKFGLTATPKRADGLQKSMFALLGDIIAEVPSEAVKSTTCPVFVDVVESPYIPDPKKVTMADGTINYASLINDMTSNQERFEMVVYFINKLESGAPILVLANRVEYLERLTKACDKKAVCLSSMGNSKAAKADRKDALQKLNSGELDVVFATYQLAKEGLDVPNLRYVIFATPEKDATTVAQAAGRVGRKAEGKEQGTVIDFVDNFGMFYGWYKKRRAVYKKNGYSFIDIL